MLFCYLVLFVIWCYFAIHVFILCSFFTLCLVGLGQPINSKMTRAKEDEGQREDEGQQGRTRANEGGLWPTREDKGQRGRTRTNDGGQGPTRENEGQRGPTRANEGERGPMRENEGE